MNDFTLQLILSDLRGAGNVGAILRTADATAVECVYACGYTPYPRQATGDSRPPHVIASNTRAIAKTALGAELTIPVRHRPDTLTAISEAKHNGFTIIMLEQAETSLNLFSFVPSSRRLALVVGNEVEGLSRELLAQASTILEIPMLGQKESLNVASAAAVALYRLRCLP
ncbi:MAG TPA: TrmH family RNA methyltransferase [Candidatus Saccharimonadia bacterium]|nr:TrmH family RNA methyltransferase [Candidatus Saccharimonadia bacterium]